MNDCNTYENTSSLTGLSKEFEITNKNVEFLNASLLDHSSFSNTSKADLISSTIDLQKNNHIKSKSNLKEKSESSSIPFIHLHTSYILFQNRKNNFKLVIMNKKRLVNIFKHIPKFGKEILSLNKRKNRLCYRMVHFVHLSK